VRSELDGAAFGVELAEVLEVDLDLGVLLEDVADLVHHRLQAGGYRGLLDACDEGDVAHVEVQRERGCEGLAQPAERRRELELVALQEKGVEQQEE